MGVHGGDIYKNRVAIDFSINVNPLGIPQRVKESLHRAVKRSGVYPDIEARKLKETVSRALAVPEEYFLFGNGASELFMALVHGIRPQKTVIAAPSFYGYEYAAKAGKSEIVYYIMKQENNFAVTEEIKRVLTEDVELLFLANPNNPTGNLTGKETLRELLRHCGERGIYVVLDECFIEFAGDGYSMISEIEEFDHLILIRAFTKIFSIPGVRLGYLACRNKALLKKAAEQLPEWNLSCFAQEAGRACMKETEFITETQKYVKRERAVLEETLRQKGFLVFPSAANFILIYRDESQYESTLYEELLQQEILIRDCGNFKGLGRGFYRIAVKSREENERLLQAIKKI